MKVDFTQPVIDPETGEQFWEPAMKRGRPIDGVFIDMTLAHFSSRALFSSSTDKGEKTLTDDEVDRRLDLAHRILNAKEPIDVDEKDRTLIQELVGRAWPSVRVRGPIRAMLKDKSEAIEGK